MVKTVNGKYSIIKGGRVGHMPFFLHKKEMYDKIFHVINNPISDFRVIFHRYS